MRPPTLNEIVWKGWTLTVWYSAPVDHAAAIAEFERSLSDLGTERERPMSDYIKTINMRAEKGDEKVEVGGTFWKDAEAALREKMAEKLSARS